MEGFIVNDDEVEESAPEDGDSKDHKRKKRRHRHPREIRIDDEDRELIAENTG
jgi:hypothetical protein